MLRSSILALVVLSTVPALAGPPYTPLPEPTKLAPPQRAQLKAALKEAKVKSARKAYADAATAWERAYALQPSLMKALVEGGWEALQAADLERAERLTKKALSFAVDHRLRGAAEYNLALVAERRNDKPGAVEAYKRSLQARHTRSAREALAKLDPAAAAAADPVKPKKLDGPWKTLEEWCATQPVYGDERGPCPVDVGPFVDTVAQLRGSGAWKGARVFGSEGSSDCHVALRTARGWFVGASFTCEDRGHLYQHLVELAFRDAVPGGAPELVFRRTDETSNREDVELEDDEGNKSTGRAFVVTGCEAYTTICGLGADGVPSCFEAQTAFADHESCSPGPPWKWQLSLDFGTAGQLDVSGKGKLSVDEKALTGKRPFAF